MSIFIDPNHVEIYVLKEQLELPEEKQIKFKLRVLTARNYSELQNAIQGKDDAGKYQTKWGSYTYEMVRRGLAGWEGTDAPAFELEAGFPTEECLNRLSAHIRSELASEIDRINSMQDEDRKN